MMQNKSNENFGVRKKLNFKGQVAQTTTLLITILNKMIMKTIDFLKWVSYTGISGENFGILKITEDFNFSDWFGIDYDIKKHGTFAYYYTDCIDYHEISYPIDNMNHRFSKPIKPNFSVDTGNFNQYKEKIWIHFYYLGK